MPNSQPANISWEVNPAVTVPQTKTPASIAMMECEEHRGQDFILIILPDELKNANQLKAAPSTMGNQSNAMWLHYELTGRVGC